MEKGIINQLQNLINPLNEGPEKDNIKKILDPLATKISKKEVLKEEEIRQFEEIIRYLEAKTGVKSSEDLKELRKEIKRLQQAIELYKSVSATAQFIQNEIANIEDRKKPKTMEKGG